MTKYDFDPHHLPPELLQAIGLAVASSAQVESVIEIAIAACAGLDTNLGGAITTHMATPLRDSALRSLAEMKIDDLDVLSELNELLDETKQAFAKRSAIVHRVWCLDGETGDVFTVRSVARVRYSSDLVPMSIDQVKSDAEFIYGAGMKLMGFLGEIDLIPDVAHARRKDG